MPDKDDAYWLRSGVISLAERVVSMGFNLGSAMLLLRLLSKEAFAAWGIFVLLTYFVEMGRSGLLQNGLIRFLQMPFDQPADKTRLISAAFGLHLAYTLFSNLILAVVAPWVATQYQVPEILPMLPVYYLTNLVWAGCTHSIYVQQAHFDFRGMLVTSIFYRGLPFLWVFVCWYTGSAVALWQWPAMQLFGAAIALWWHRKVLFNRDILQGINYWQWYRTLLNFGKFVLGTNLSTMMYKNADKLILGKLLGPAAFAVYDVAGRVTQLVEAPAFSIASVVFPKSAERMALEGASGVRQLYEKSVGATLAVILPFVLLVLLFPELLVRFFAGTQYPESVELLRITAFFGLFMPFAVQFGTALDAGGKPAVNFIFTLGTALLNLALCYWMVPIFGLKGAAFATLAGYMLSFLAMQTYLYYTFGVVAVRAFRYLPEFYKKLGSVIRRIIWKH
jgi:O-antigen/teichoic acid export membrane protein